MDGDMLRIRLVVSNKMTESPARENGYIRFAKAAREFVSIQEKTMTVSSKDGNKLSLIVKPAYKDDIDFLISQLKEKKITDDQAKITGFVSSNTMQKMTGQILGGGQTTRKHIFISFVSPGIFPLTLGCDPEFVFVDPATNRVKEADKVLGIMCEDGKNYPEKFGADFHLVELRPDPTNDAASLVKNISQLLEANRNNKSISNLLWRGGATYGAGIPGHRVYTLGGHIHVGQPSALVKETREKKDIIYKRIINILDELAGVPMVMIDGPDQGKRRNNPAKPFGKYGDTRPQKDRFEWRVPSGIWLVSPEVAEAVLGTTQAITEACYEIMLDGKPDMNMISGPEDMEGCFLSKMKAAPTVKVEKLLNNSNPDDISKDFLSGCFNKLKNLSSYKRHKDQIDSFCSITGMTDGDRKKIKYDLKETWFNGKSFIY